MGMKGETGREKTVPSCMGSQGLPGFWGHFGRYLNPTPLSGPDPTWGSRGVLPPREWLGLGAGMGFPFPQPNGGLLPLGEPWKDQYSDSEW